MDKDTQVPVKEKMSKMAILIDKSHNAKTLAEVEFNMANIKDEEYNDIQLPLPASLLKDFPYDEESCSLEIALRGTFQEGLVKKRMTAMQDQMAKAL